ncbi:SH3 domain-containing protein [Myxococcus sp. K15C18031901]|uniref:SH3 domain-containing protein n=1 Tax=Myxococcus dinghuensis TaxID=2906761 RepID=UPI0020A73334|nr:SH3 domain-containing protein [Myxococcus dinghuensis]MCP3102955.1 SH3 domain-containing protein [Myxococcus dinghuensis]
MTPVLLMSLALAQTPPVSLQYSAPDDAARRTLESYEFTEWEPSAKADLYVGVDEANLRQSPAADAAVVSTLPLGAAVRVLERRAERVKVGEYVNHWYSVEYVDTKGTPATEDDQRHTGWLFGNTLTPFRFESDFDGDGELEVATVVMSGDFKIRVRVMEPQVKPPRRVSSVDITPAGGGFLSVDGGPATGKLVSSKTAGIPLVQVDSLPEACGDYRTSLVSYTVPGKKKGVLGKAKLALELAGMSDPPSHSDFKISFQPKSKGLTVAQTTYEDDEKGGKKDEVTTRTPFRLSDGVYQEQIPSGVAGTESMR